VTGVQTCALPICSSVADRVKAIVIVEVREARPVVSPAYDDGSVTEAEMIRTFQDRLARLHQASER